MRYCGVILVLVLIFGCQRESPFDHQKIDAVYSLDIPPGFPAPPVPEDNLLTHSKVDLGKRLFFDPQLSSDNSISCASCHQPHLAFAETNAISIGVNQSPGIRNAPSLANVAYQQGLFAEGGIPSLELQAIAPLTETHEMNMNLDELMKRLEADESYVQQFQKAYQSPPTKEFTVKALAAYQRTLLSGNSRFDQYYYHDKNDALNEAEKRGMDLFFSERTNCSSCHSGYLFTDQSFSNVGLYVEYEDEGRARLTADPADNGKFKVPSLRNIAVTAPYMHNGSMETLEEVIEHFNSGGAGHENQHELVKPLSLTETEKADLVAFLKSLTDDTFLTDQQHRP